MPDSPAITFFQPLYLQPKFVRERWWIRWPLGLFLFPSVASLLTYFVSACLSPLGFKSQVDYFIAINLIFALFIASRVVSNSCGNTFQRFITIPKGSAFATAQLAIWRTPISILQWRLFSLEAVTNIQLIKSSEDPKLFLNISQGRALELHAFEQSDKALSNLDELAAQLADLMKKEHIVTDAENAPPSAKSILWTESKITFLAALFLVFLATLAFLIEAAGTPASARPGANASDCLYLYEGPTRLNDVEVSIIEADGTTKVTTNGIHWVKQTTNRAKELTFKKGDQTCTVTIPAPTDMGWYDTAPHGEPYCRSIGKRRYFKIDLNSETITPCDQ